MDGGTEVDDEPSTCPQAPCTRISTTAPLRAADAQSVEALGNLKRFCEEHWRARKDRVVDCRERSGAQRPDPAYRRWSQVPGADPQIIGDISNSER